MNKLFTNVRIKNPLHITGIYLSIILILLLPISALSHMDIWNSADAYPASLNGFWSVLWFAEAVAFIVLAALLLTYYKQRFGLIRYPFLLAALAAFGALWFFIGVSNNSYYPLVNGGIQYHPSSYIEDLASTPLRYHTGDSHDYELESILPKFVFMQWPFVIGLVAGTGYALGQKSAWSKMPKRAGKRAAK
jgi:hypothetical protein